MVCLHSLFENFLWFSKVTFIFVLLCKNFTLFNIIFSRIDIFFIKLIKCSIFPTCILCIVVFMINTEKDVNRTDRTLEFYAGENNPNLKSLYDILMTYVMYNFNLGYVQGMSDLLSPILYVMGNEVDAFWCFVGFMNRVVSYTMVFQAHFMFFGFILLQLFSFQYNNFDVDQAGIKKQLSGVQKLLGVVVPDLASYLNSQESANMFFCFRMLLVQFKREFILLDIMTLWEVMYIFICFKK